MLSINVAAVVATVEGTASEIAAAAPAVQASFIQTIKAVMAQAGMGGPKGWAVGLLGAAAVVYGFKWARKNLPARVAGYVTRAITAGLEAKGIQNGDLKALIRNVTLELVKFAEKKLPDEGMGPARLALIESMLCGLPWIGFLFRWVIATRRADFEAIIEDCIRLMDEELKRAGQQPRG